MFAFIEQPIESKIIDFSSKEVFAERKQGNIQKAYKMAQQLVQHNPKDSWNHKALAWCLIDLIKQAQLYKMPAGWFSEIRWNRHRVNCIQDGRDGWR